jgi:hypothetical protein
MKIRKRFPVMVPTAAQQQWLAEKFAKVTSPERVNPCVQVFGKGPDGAICKSCAYLFAHQPGNKRFYKCELRNFTHGAASDHKVRWPACGRYEAAKVTS